MPRLPYPALDGLRGVAILSVLLFHLTPQPYVTHPVLLAWQHVTRLGWMGVDLFFVLSGFLITGILLDARDTTGRARAFYMRRVLRIVPLYYVVLAGLACYFAMRPDARVEGHVWLAWCAAYLTNYLPESTRQALLPGATWHFWSLAVEEQFYLAWPLVVWRTSPRQLLRVAAVLVVIAIIVRTALHFSGHSFGAYYLTFARMDALVIGAALAVAQRDNAWWDRCRSWAHPVSLGAVACLPLILFARWNAPGAGNVQRDGWMQTLGYTLVAIGAAAWVVRAVEAGPAGTFRWLMRGALPWFGRYAYGLYVYHLIVWQLAIPALAQRGLLGPSPDARPWWGTAIRLSLSVGVSTISAIVSYHVLEAPFLRLKRYFPVRIRRVDGATGKESGWALHEAPEPV